jgi:hypothetical protein
MTKEGKPAIIYHGQGSGRNQIAIAEDDALASVRPENHHLPIFAGPPGVAQGVKMSIRADFGVQEAAGQTCGGGGGSKRAGGNAA